MSTTPVKVLLIEDNPGDVRLIQEALCGADLSRPLATAFELVSASSLAEGLAHLGGGDFNLVLVDLSLPDSQGLDTFLKARAAGPPLPVIVMTGLNDEKLAVQAVSLGAQDYVVKGVLDSDALVRVILYAMERHRLTVELERTNRDLVLKNREMQNFYHTVSHELQTPLTSVQEFLAMALEEKTPALAPKQRVNLETARSLCVQMNQSITDLIDATTLESGKPNFQPKPKSLGELVGRFVAAMAPAAEAGGVSLTQEVEPDLPPIPIDEKMITQVLAKLLNNALKFTPAGGRVRISVGQELESRDFVRVSVIDTGRGIEEERVKQLYDRLYFDRLYQVQRDHPETLDESGLGLGLFISREIVRLHGGMIWLESEMGQGSRFIFILPKRKLEDYSRWYA